MFENKTPSGHLNVVETGGISVSWCHELRRFVSKPVLTSCLQDMRARCHVGLGSNTHAAKMASKLLSG